MQSNVIQVIYVDIIMELIDKVVVKSELEKQVKRLEDAFDNPSFASYEANLIEKGGYRKLKDILSFLNTIEVKEVDLEKEYDNEFFKDPVFGKLVNRNAGISIAKYFFELCMQVSNKMQKGE